jgi:hypothetical protein
LFKGDVTAFEKLHECWPADAEEVGSLTGRKSLAPRDDRDRLAFAHRRHHLEEHLIDLRGKRHLFIVDSPQRHRVHSMEHPVEALDLPQVLWGHDNIGESLCSQ